MRLELVDGLGTAIFAIAVLHTFLVNQIRRLSRRFQEGSFLEAFLHLASEIEVVFGLWAAVFLVFFGLIKGFHQVVAYQESLSFTEPLFVFCIMVMAATRPVLWAAERLMGWLSQILSTSFRLPRSLTDYFVILTLGPLSGSLITEPAAITVSALLLGRLIQKPPQRFLYALLGLLFVNVSIGGALTPFAAPPILMVARTWRWDFFYVITHLGWRAALAVVINALLFVIYFRKDIVDQNEDLREEVTADRVPLYVVIVQYGFLLLLVLNSHHANMAVGIFLMFLGFTTVTRRFQGPLRLRESLLVAFFLGGIIEFGVFQRWWLSPLLTHLNDTALYLGATGLTAITDNAALTYLGSQVPSLTAASKYFLVAGAISGGGLTIIANAPNAAGYSLLQDRFKGGLEPVRLFLSALPFTLIVMMLFGISI